MKNNGTRNVPRNGTKTLSRFDDDRRTDILSVKLQTYLIKYK